MYIYIYVYDIYIYINDIWCIHDIHVIFVNVQCTENKKYQTATSATPRNQNTLNYK